MRNALHDIHVLYRHLVPAGSNAPLRVSHSLGQVWFAGHDRVLQPEVSTADAPWCQLGVVPSELTDGIEDRLIVCDAQLARHALAWRVEAEANTGNVFLREARRLGLVERVDAVFPGVTVLFGGTLVEPLGEARFVATTATLDGIRLTAAEVRHVARQVGVDTIDSG